MRALLAAELRRDGAAAESAWSALRLFCQDARDVGLDVTRLRALVAGAWVSLPESRQMPPVLRGEVFGDVFALCGDGEAVNADAVNGVYPTQARLSDDRHASAEATAADLAANGRHVAECTESSPVREAFAAALLAVRNIRARRAVARVREHGPVHAGPAAEHVDALRREAMRYASGCRAAGLSPERMLVALKRTLGETLPTIWCESRAEVEADVVRWAIEAFFGPTSLQAIGADGRPGP